MCALLVESDSSALSNVSNHAVLCYLSEYHLSTKSRIKKVHGYYNPPDYQTSFVSDVDSEYKDIVDLSERIKNMYAAMPTSRHDKFIHVEINQKPPAWQTHIKDATTVENIVLIIRLFGQSSIADRLDYLHGLLVDEPYQKPMSLESVRGFALFIMNRAYLPYPDITVNADGRVTIEWDVAGRSTLILEFISSEYVEYLEVFQQHKSVQQRQYNSGVSSIDSVMNAVRLWPYTR